jgi:transcriptional regulator with XRE-family HTH domain
MIRLAAMLNTAKIRALREKRGLTQAAAATAAGFKGRQAWWNIEAGRQGAITLATLQKVARVLGVRPKDLL